MRSRAFSVALDDRSATPLFAQIAQAIASDITSGRLQHGDTLPGTRSLAETLGVHRTTVVAAYAELEEQGWVGTRHGSSTFVATAVPDRPIPPAQRVASVSGVARCVGFPLDDLDAHMDDALPRRQETLTLCGTFDPRLFPTDMLGRACRRALREHGSRMLGYTHESRGQERLRTAIAAMVASGRSISARPDDVMITRGSQMAIDLIARSMISRGDVVAVESPGYRPAHAVFQRAGARIVPIDVDAHGLDVDALERHSRIERIRLVYVTPHHQYPTTVVLSPARRLALLELARKTSMAVVEDDYDQEFHYDGRPVLPMASRDPYGHVIYVGTLAKTLAPGLRLGFVVAPEPLLARMSRERELIDRQGDGWLEHAVGSLLENGEARRHVRRMRRIYLARRDALCEAIDKHLTGVVSYGRPSGGIALWTEVSPSIDVERWHQRALDKGIVFRTGRHFSFDGASAPYARFEYAALDERALAVAVQRIAQCVGHG